MCMVKTVVKYDLILARLREIVNMFPETGNFLEWYHVRRFHLFPAFTEGLHSGVKLAESNNVKWKPHTKLSLVAAAKDDVTTMIEQECEYKRFNGGDSIPIERGPTDIQWATQEKRMQMEQGRAIGEMFANQAAMDMQSASEKDPDYFIPNRAAKHKPGKGTKTFGQEETQGYTLNQLLEKLNKAKRISTGEEGQEPVIADEDHPAAPTGPVLALSQDLLEISLQQMTVPTHPM